MICKLEILKVKNPGFRTISWSSGSPIFSFQAAKTVKKCCTARHRFVEERFYNAPINRSLKKSTVFQQSGYCIAAGEVL